MGRAKRSRRDQSDGESAGFEKMLSIELNPTGLGVQLKVWSIAYEPVPSSCPLAGLRGRSAGSRKANETRSGGHQRGYTWLIHATICRKDRQPVDAGNVATVLQAINIRERDPNSLGR